MYTVLQHLSIKNLQLHNRLILPPMASGRFDEDGYVTQEVLEHYNKMSSGAYLSLIITEHCFVSQEGKAHQNQMSIASDQAIAGLARLTDIIHKNGVYAIAQLSHAGERADTSVTGFPVVMPSSLSSELSGKKAHILSCDEIHILIQKFTSAAIRAKEAGYDGVELHAAHRYLLNQFFSPLTNLRTDCYGGDVSGRCTLLCQIIASIRQSVGPDYPIFVRLGACDYLPGGNEISDAIAAAQLLTSAGVDVLDISGGVGGYIRKDMTNIPGYFSDVSAAIRQTVSVPVILTGGITKIQDANQLIKHGKADLIGIGRAMWKDPSWAQRNIQSIQSF